MFYEFVQRMIVGSIIFGITACATAKVTSSGGSEITSAQMESYNGPKARIAVADFEDKMSSSGQYNAAYGRGMSDMLTNALFHTNRYIVLEREKLHAVIAEQNLGASGRVKKETAAPIGEIEGAELMVTAAITGFDPGASGGDAGLGGLLKGNLSAITGAFKSAHVAMDLRVVDTRTARVLASTSVEGSATAFGGAGSMIGGPMSGSLGGFAKTPLDTAIREMIKKAVDFIVSQTPQSFYHFSANGELIKGTNPGALRMAKVGENGHPSPSSASSTSDEIGSPEAKKVMKSIRTDFDQNLIAQLNKVTRRGAILSVVVSFRFEGAKESQFITVSKERSNVMDYDSGQSYPMTNLDGFSRGRVHPGEVVTLQATFKAPKDAKAVGITISGVGTFEDIKLSD